MKRHSRAEKSVALDQAHGMIAQGQSQAAICEALGISVMTFHRWRKELGTHPRNPVNGNTQSEEGDIEIQIAVLREENRRLRTIVTDLLLEKAKVEEAVGRSKTKA